MARAASDPQVGAIVVVTHTQPSQAVLGAYAVPNHPDAVHNGAHVNAYCARQSLVRGKVM